MGVTRPCWIRRRHKVVTRGNAIDYDTCAYKSPDNKPNMTLEKENIYDLDSTRLKVGDRIQVYNGHIDYTNLEGKQEIPCFRITMPTPYPGPNREGRETRFVLRIGVDAILARIKQLKCPGSHGLEMLLTRFIESRSCDVCSHLFTTGDELYGCGKCNWHACAKCCERRRRLKDSPFRRLASELGLDL